MFPSVKSAMVHSAGEHKGKRFNHRDEIEGTRFNQNLKTYSESNRSSFLTNNSTSQGSVVKMYGNQDFILPSISKQQHSSKLNPIGDTEKENDENEKPLECSSVTILPSMFPKKRQVLNQINTKNLNIEKGDDAPEVPVQSFRKLSMSDRGYSIGDQSVVNTPPSNYIEHPTSPLMQPSSVTQISSASTQFDISTHSYSFLSSPHSTYSAQVCVSGNSSFEGTSMFPSPCETIDSKFCNGRITFECDKNISPTSGEGTNSCDNDYYCDGDIDLSSNSEDEEVSCSSSSGLDGKSKSSTVNRKIYENKVVKVAQLRTQKSQERHHLRRKVQSSFCESDTDTDTDTDTETEIDEKLSVDKKLSKVPKSKKKTWDMTTTTASETFTENTLKETGSQVVNVNDEKVEVFVLEDDDSEDGYCKAEIVPSHVDDNNVPDYSTDSDHEELQVIQTDPPIERNIFPTPITNPQQSIPSSRKNLHHSKGTSVESFHSRVSVERRSKRNIVKRGKWTLGSRIGVGSFGVVHVGMNGCNGNLMAVKSMNIPSSSSGQLMEDLQREIDLMRTLSHSNIVRYIGAEIDTSKHVLHIFQEWVPGGSVASLLQKFGAFPLAVVRSYLYQVLLGLDYLHSNRILHRDIKGGNILVSDQGVVKLADFGASKRIAINKNGTVMEMEDMMERMTMRGTPYYMALEVFEEKYGPKADIWSCGCVAYQMFTSTPPWKELGIKSPLGLYKHLTTTHGPPPMNIIRKNDGSPVISRLDCAQFKSLQSLLSLCFQRNPTDRPNTQGLLNHVFFSERDPNESIFDEESVVSESRNVSASSPLSFTKLPVELNTKVTSSSQHERPIFISGKNEKSPLLSKILKEKCILSRNPDIETEEITKAQSCDIMENNFNSENWPSWAKNAEKKNENSKLQEKDNESGAILTIDKKKNPFGKNL